MIYYYNIQRPFPRLQLEPELFPHRGEQRTAKARPSGLSIQMKCLTRPDTANAFIYNEV